MPTLSLRQVADRAGVDDDYVRRLIDLGAIGPEGEGYAERDVNLVALLGMWEEAGLSASAILTAVEDGVLSLDFLESPAWDLPEPLPITYREFADEQGIPLSLLQGVQEAIGFARPEPDDRVARDDAVLTELVRIVLDIGGTEETVLRLLAVYGDNLRRLVRAEADLYLEQLEGPWADAGADTSELMRRGARLGRRMAGPIHDAMLAIHERHRQHVWTTHGVERAEVVLERAGLVERSGSTPAICFVDLTGYTRLTEERGDETAARLAASLASIVEAISRRHGGRAIRWLGDGGMFYFKEAEAAVVASLEMRDGASAAGLPSIHIGVHAGPVVFRDGDVYGRTVNIASRIADRAEAGEVLTSRETVDRLEVPAVRFVPVGSAELQGLAAPVDLYRIRRAGSEGR